MDRRVDDTHDQLRSDYRAAIKSVANVAHRRGTRCLAWMDGHDPDPGQPRGLADPDIQRYVAIEIRGLVADMEQVLNELE